MDKTNKKIRAVIFDYGNVLFSYDPPLEELADIYGVSVNEIMKHSYLAEQLGLGEISEEDYWKQLSDSLEKPVPENAKDFWRNDFRNSLPLRSDIIQFVDELNESGLKTALLSNTIPPHAEVMRDIDSLDRFDLAVLSPEVGVRKPDKEIYKITLDRLGVEPEESIFIDDREENVEAAEKLGISTVLAKNTQQIIEDVKTLLEANN